MEVKSLPDRIVPPEPLLEVSSITKQFGGLLAVGGVDFQVAGGEIIGLIGPNGAGKTTIFNLLTGIYVPTRGKIRFAGADITGKKPQEVVRQGLVRTFQQTRVLFSIPVLENLLTGFHCRTKSGVWGAIWKTGSKQSEEGFARDQAIEILRFIGLLNFKDELARNIPQDAQRRLAIAVALATQPKMLLLDEPTVGMNPNETQEMIRLIGAIREKGITILLIEHDMRVVMGICQRIIVLNYGSKIAEGLPQEIRNNPEVIAAYLGSEESA